MNRNDQNQSELQLCHLHENDKVFITFNFEGNFVLKGEKRWNLFFFWLADVNPASVQAFHGDAKALTFLAEPVARWNGAVLKDHRPGGLRVPSHLEEEHRENTPSETLTPSAI